ncbi:hypothetical protein AcW1_007642 [Taiwanofungus camphoratus]|nr:hypothetical protein AcW2_007296 [Antrodia cinnamomea]KAI0926988.1 hypothetical protein AcV5_007640 [Antrodia cinnamomea]KAI0953418.1 hypothetical protein AcW1_007642 [Antrodia cinnamomea]
MQCSEAEETDSNFSEPDTYALNLTIVSPLRSAGSHVCESSRRIVLDIYKGWPESLDAPEWTKWSPGHTVVFRQLRSNVTAILRVALWQHSLGPLIEALELVQI